MGAAVGWMWYRVVPIRRDVARQNVAGALGDELDARAQAALVAGMYRHLGLCIVELAHFAGAPVEQLTSSVDVTGRHSLEAALSAQRGVIVLTAHLGNWELLMRMGALTDRPVSVISKRLSRPRLDAIWQMLRAGGPRILSAQGSARAAVRALQRNEIVGYVLDQNMPPKHAVYVPFFGRLAAADPGLARLARITGAPVVPVFAERRGGRHCIRIEPALDLPRSPNRSGDILEATARCTAVVEAAIRRAPEQWLWIHRRWKPLPAAVQGGVGPDRADRKSSRVWRGDLSSDAGSDLGRLFRACSR